MRKTVKVVLISAVLSWGALGLRHAQGGLRDAEQTAGGAHAFISTVLREEMTVRSDDNSFVLKNLSLEGTRASAILKGEIVNTSERDCGEVAFKVLAYGRDGRLLKGFEEETIFVVRGMKAKSSASLNDGRGVWLQGVSKDEIARIEVARIESERAASTTVHASRVEE